MKKLHLCGSLITWIRVSFFFQAEDGIRDFHVTGVQTCALPISTGHAYDSDGGRALAGAITSLMTSTDRKSTRLNSSHVKISYAVFCLKKKKTRLGHHHAREKAYNLISMCVRHMGRAA